MSDVEDLSDENKIVLIKFVYDEIKQYIRNNYSNLLNNLESYKKNKAHLKRIYITHLRHIENIVGPLFDNTKLEIFKKEFDVIY